MTNEIQENHTISPFFIMFPLYVGTVGVGILTYQSKVIEHAGYNAWISVLVAGLGMQIVLGLIYYILSAHRDSPEIITINRTLFRTILGGLFNAGIVSYFFFGAFLKLKVFIEMIQIWLFPTMNILPLSMGMALLIYYAVSGGFRAVIGICVWGAILSLASEIPEVLLAVPFLHPQNIFPLLNHSGGELLLSSKSMALEFLGFETLLLFYPFIRTPEKSRKWAHLTLGFITCLYLMILVLTFMFFSEGQLRHSIWPTIDVVSIFEVPLLQRLEYFFISLWLIKIVAGVSLYVWAACRGMKTAFHFGATYCLIGFLIVMVVLNYFIADHRTIHHISDLYGTIGFYFICAYIPFIAVCVWIRKGLMRRFPGRRQV
ncbi:GerAB/ArcD/ProY family transporter [Paenibacillus koleovorans]|uniref:GerAB/ArcD/ProY family transporter n=1 Tax=Paenibacillus koleovorans TaxID=121608 RepID=UPI000FD873F8|nr:GerAB/ArcD/ProY family transporter [Paenibacillus koleovorans]